MLMSTSRLSRRQYLHPQLAEPLDSCEKLIPRLGGAHAGRRARHDEIARFQGVVLREKRDLFGHAPDHLVDVRVLARLAVHFEPELAFFQSERGVAPELGHRPDDLERARTDRDSPFTLSQSLPFFGCPLFDAGVIGPTGADWLKVN